MADRDGRGRGHDSGGSGGRRDPENKRTPEHEAIQRVHLVRMEVESTATRTGKLAGILHRDTWRKERAELQVAHADLEARLHAHEADAKASERAHEDYTAATHQLRSIGEVLEAAREPQRPVPPVSGEEAIEPSILGGSAIGDDVLAWVAGMSDRERRTIVERVQRVQHSVDREDAFAVGLANYLGNRRIQTPFFAVARDPRRFHRAAYEKARARRAANGAAEQHRATIGAKPAAPSLTSDASDADRSDDRAPPVTGAAPTAASLLDARAGTGGPLPYRAEMERSFGRSFGDVEAHTGMAAELEPLGAQALTIGRTVAFADAQPSPAMVTHEATHAAQNEQAGAAVAMASGVVAPRDSAAEAEADTNAHLVAAQGPDVRLPPIAAAPAAHVHLAPKLLAPAPDAAPPTSMIRVPDADHPARRDSDGEQVIQTGQITTPGKATPLRSTSWHSLAEVTESVNIQVDSGDTLRIDITYRLESRPAEVGEVPDTWIHTERKALVTLGSGEHAGATIVGQGRVHLAPGDARDPKAAVARVSIGAAHWAQVYLAEAGQYVNLHGPGGRASLRADTADNDVLAYDDPLRTLVGLKHILKQQHVAGHGGEVARMHARAQQLLADAKRGHAVLEREIASIASYHDPHPGAVAPVRFLVGDIAGWLAANQRTGRDDTEDARQLGKARAELEQQLADADNVHPAKRNQIDDGLDASVRFVERTAEGAGELGAIAVDAVVLGIDATGQATGIGTFDYHPISKYGKSIDDTGATTTTALVTMVNGFADEWSEAVERAHHGDYRSLTDVSVDTLMMIDGARTGGVLALENAEVLAAKLGNVAKSARALASQLPAGARDIAAITSRLPAEARDIAAAMADGADAFVARVRAGGLQMATGGGGGGPGPNLGGLSAETLADAAQAAKDAFKDKRLAQAAGKHADPAAQHADPTTSSPADPTPPADSALRPNPEKAAATADSAAADSAEKEAQRAAKSAAGNAEINATKKYAFEAAEKATVEKKVRDAAAEVAEKAYKNAIAAGETPAKANTAANKVAKEAAEHVATIEAERSATEAAERALDSGGAFDMGKVDSRTRSQLADFIADKTAVEAKRLAKELSGLSEKDFLAKMTSEPCTMKAVNIAGPPPQVMHVHEYPDGTVVRYKPLGDANRPGPTYSIEVKKDPSVPDLGKDDAAFKVDSAGKAVPKGPAEVKNPYPVGSSQARKFRNAIMDAGHKTLK